MVDTADSKSVACKSMLVQVRPGAHIKYLKVYLMLNQFFNRLFSVFSSMSFVQKVKKDENGICYVTGLRRHISVLFDLIIIILLLQFFGQSVNYLFTNSESGIMLNQAAAKYQMVPLSAEEMAVRSRYLKLVILNQIVQFIILFSYVAYMWIKFSATPGKLLLGLRVVDANTFEKITLKQATKRFFSFMLSVAPLFLGYMWANFNKRCQTWHDKIADTVVVTNKSLINFQKNKT